MRYGMDYGRGYDRRMRGRRSGRRGWSPASPWLADPIGGRVGYDRFYGEQRAARYGERYDFGYAPLSDLNPISRQLRGEYQRLAAQRWRRVRPPGYDYGY